MAYSAHPRTMGHRKPPHPSPRLTGITRRRTAADGGGGLAPAHPRPCTVIHNLWTAAGFTYRGERNRWPARPGAARLGRMGDAGYDPFPPGRDPVGVRTIQ